MPALSSGGVEHSPLNTLERWVTRLLYTSVAYQIVMKRRQPNLKPIALSRLAPGCGKLRASMQNRVCAS